MDASTIRGISRFVILLALSFPRSVAAAQIAVDCDTPRASDERDLPGALQRAINTSRPGDTIVVRGTCNENVTIPVGKDLITLDGSGTAAISGPDPTQPTVLVRGRDITIRGFTISRGRDGIAVVIQGGARVDGNTIHNTGRYGIYISRLSFAAIVNNTIHDNSQAGIAVGVFATAFIGFETGLETIASPNLITGNGAQGIVVAGNAHARIVGNDISDNRANGVNVREASNALISDNIVNGNGLNGILVAQGSGVYLGTDTGDTIFTRPNRTTANNLGFGIRCRVGGFVDGRLGSLNGDSGPEDYLEGCIPSLIR
jgi:parallel beta-helix repeat protein